MDTPSTSAGHTGNAIREEHFLSDAEESDIETVGQSVSNLYVLQGNNETNSDTDTGTEVADVQSDTAELGNVDSSDTDTADTDEGVMF